MKTHKLKTWSEYYRDVLNGIKTFEIRENDRDYKVGDKLVLMEYEPCHDEFSGNQLVVTVTYITAWEQKEDFVVMGVVHDA